MPWKHGRTNTVPSHANAKNTIKPQACMLRLTNTYLLLNISSWLSLRWFHLLHPFGQHNDWLLINVNKCKFNQILVSLILKMIPLYGRPFFCYVLCSFFQYYRTCDVVLIIKKFLNWSNSSWMMLDTFRNMRKNKNIWKISFIILHLK